jgi:DNA polymerase III subunit gamma/tau
MEEFLSVGHLIQAIAQGGVIPAASNGTAVGSAGGSGSDGVKKNGPLTLANGRNGSDNPTGSVEGPPALDLSEGSVAEVWQATKRILLERSPLLAKQLDSALSPAIFGPNSLAIRFAPGYNHAYQACATEQGVQRVQDALKRVTGQPVVVRFDAPPSGPATAEGTAAQKPQAASAAERKKSLMTLPMFQKAADALGAQLWHVDDAFDPAAVAPVASTPAASDDTDEAQ